MVQAGEKKPETLANFHPKFTYPIFGTEERIFGYRGLIIRLRFTAHDLRQNVHISYDERFTTVDDASAVDLIAKLKPFIAGHGHVPGRPEDDDKEGKEGKEDKEGKEEKEDKDGDGGYDAFAKLSEYERAVQNDPTAKDFVPPGRLVHSYSSKGRSFEIWAGSLADPQVKRLLERAQIFVSFFVEAGVPLKTSDPEWTLQRWAVYFVYAVIPTNNCALRL